MTTGIHFPQSANLPVPGARAGKLDTSVTRPVRRKRDRSGKQQALLEAATRLFAQRGYENTTTREIAASAGCAEGLIHRYFDGNAGLMLALIQNRVSQEVEELADHVPVAANLEQEFLRLVEWELDRMWEDRDFLRVIIPRSLLDAEVGHVLGRVGTSRHALVIRRRLSRFARCQSLKKDELDCLARFIGVLGFGFGFLRPVILGQNRARSRKMAMTIAKMLLRGL